MIALWAAPGKQACSGLMGAVQRVRIMMPPEQRLKTRIILRADHLHLKLIQNDLFLDLRQNDKISTCPKPKKV
jgi:hypothetical protein